MLRAPDELCRSPRLEPRPIPGELRIGVFGKVNELTSELDALTFRDCEEFVDAKVKGLETRAAHSSYAARAKGSGDGLGETGLAEPLVSALRRVLVVGILHWRVTVGPGTARIGAGGIVRLKREREAGMQAENTVDLPVADERNDHLVHVLAIPAAAAERDVVGRVSG